MHLSDFDYILPSNLIAQEPINPRDNSRLLVLEKDTGGTEHKHFYNLDEYLNKGDVVVMNNSKVIPARLIGKKKDTGGRIEVFLHKNINDDEWECIVGGRKVAKGLNIVFENDLSASIEDKQEEDTWRVKFNKKGEEFMKDLYKIGQTPLPPYIKRDKGEQRQDSERYQTVYADEKKKGSVAAPTAGLHFTDRMMEKLKRKGVRFEYVTLHVGLGTFAPVKTEKVEDHKIHSEWAEVTAETLKSIIKAKREGRRVVAVGTTCVRTLEAIFQDREYAKYLDTRYKLQVTSLKLFAGWVNIFIYPGFEFRVVDAMLTNFHLPKSSLLMLVSAFAGKDNIDNAYQEAINEKYRFYSYGDAMLIH
jgi:S-adenosylmethionine:tRNA ribosyltransferase-isomerase